MKTKLVKVSPNCWTVRYNGRDIGTIWRDPVPDGEWNAEGDHSSWACETKQQAIDLLVSERDTDKDKIYSLQKKVKKLQTLLKKANAEIAEAVDLLHEYRELSRTMDYLRP